MNTKVLNRLYFNSRSINLFLFLSIFCSLGLNASDKYNDKRINNYRWNLNSEGGISWIVNKDKYPHTDHIEMSGLRVSTVLRYGVDANGAFMLNRSMVWPMLRTIPNNTHASLMRRFAWNVTDMVEVNGQSLLNEKVKEVTLNGTMVVQSEYTLPRKGKLGLTRILFPSVSNPAFCEKYILFIIDKIIRNQKLKNFLNHQKEITQQL